MSLKISTGIKIPARSFHAAVNAGRDHQMQQQTLVEEDTYDENDHQEPYEDPPPPRRKVGTGCLTTGLTENAHKTIPATESIVPALQHTHKYVKPGKVRLTTEIRKDLHTRLRIHAIKTDKSFIQIIEEWIETNCPE